MSKITPLKGDPRNMTIWDFYNNYENSHAPKEYQRPTCWTNKNRKDYFKSILMNRTSGIFTFVDIEMSKYNIENIDKTHNSFNFYKKILEEKCAKHIVLDGNNRLKFIESLLNDEYNIPRGTYEYLPNNNSNTQDEFTVGRNFVFSKLPTIVQKAIKSRIVTVNEYYQITHEGLSEVFININSGQPLKPQELRNVFPGFFAPYIRSISEQIEPLLTLVFGKDYNHRLRGDEWIVECIDMHLNNYCEDEETGKYKISGVNQTSKNDLYKKNTNSFNVNFDHENVTKKFKILESYLKDMINIDKMNQKSITKKSTVMNLFWMMLNGIETYEEARESVILHEKSYKNKNLRNDEDDSFAFCCGGTGLKHMEFRMKVLPNIVEKVKSKISS